MRLNNPPVLSELKTLDPDRLLGAIATIPDPLPAANKGDYYLFNANGNLTFNSNNYFVSIGDRLRCDGDNTPPNTPLNWSVILTNPDATAIALSETNKQDLGVDDLDSAIATIKTLATPKEIPVYASKFGAVGDGVTDDTAAIQAALNYTGNLLQAQQDLGRAGKSICFLAGGTYKISSTLIVRRGTSLIGETKVVPYPNQFSGFKNNYNIRNGTEIVCTADFVGTEAIYLEADNTGIENVIIDGHAIPKGTTWTQINITTAQDKWLSTAYIKLPVHDPADFRISNLKFDNIEIPKFRLGEYMEFQLQAIGGVENEYSSKTTEYNLISGNILQGLTLSSSGLLGGAATQLETVYGVIEITDSEFISIPGAGVVEAQNTYQRSFALSSILDEIKTREILPPTVGAAYSYQLKTWYDEPVTWQARDIPDWLSLSATGELTNNRTTTADDVEHFIIVVELYHSSTLLDKRTIKSELRYADAAIRILGEQTLMPQQGVAFSYKYLASGGYGDYTWSINATRTNSEFPENSTTATVTSPYEGLAINPATAEITGTITTLGRNQYYLRCTSNTDNTIFFEGLFYIEAIAAGETPKIISRSLATAIKGVPYSFQFNLEDIPAAKPYNNIEAINLPTGLSIDNDLLITGTATGANFVDGIAINWSCNVIGCTIRGFVSGAGIVSRNQSNIHRIEGCNISACDSGFRSVSQTWDSHVFNNFFYNLRIGLNLGAGSSGTTYLCNRIEYCHEDGVTLNTAHENKFIANYFDTCGWRSGYVENSDNLIFTGNNSYRPGRNLIGIGTKLNPQADVEYSCHINLKNCHGSNISSNNFDLGTKDGGEGLYLTDHFLDNVRPSIGIRIHNTPGLIISSNKLTGCVGDAISANLTDFGENDYRGCQIKNNSISDRTFIELKSSLQEQKLYIPNADFEIWQRDREFNIPPSTDGNPTEFAVADGWSLKRGGNTAINQNTIVSRGTDAPIGTGHYLHLEKLANTTGQTSQTLELSNYLSSKLEYTSNRSIILSYYARSATNTSLGVKVSQYADSADNSFASYQFTDNNRTILNRWKRYQHYFRLADLRGISFGAGAIFNIVFRCDRSEEDIDLDIMGVRVYFADVTPFAADFVPQDLDEELKFAQLRYQKSKDYEQYFPSWSNGYRYDVNGANWNPGYINQFASTVEGHSLRESVQFENPVLIIPGTGLEANFNYLSILNPGQLTNRTSATKFNWSGLDEPPPNIDRANKTGFTFSARGSMVVANGSYSAHWLYTTDSKDKQANGGGYK